MPPFSSGGVAGVLDTVSGEAVDGSSLPTVTSCRVVANMAANGTLPVRSCRGIHQYPMGFEGTSLQGCTTGLHECLAFVAFPC